MIDPQFPYRGNQIILSSDRVLLHSKSDAIFLFGKGAVSLCSTQTINLDAKEKILIDSDKIELGNKAESEGEPVVLGRTLNDKLIELLGILYSVGKELEKVNTSQIGTSMSAIRTAGTSIAEISNKIKLELSANQILSKNTFTR